MKILPITNYTNYNRFQNKPVKNNAGTTSPVQNHYVSFGQAQKFADILLNHLKEPRRKQQMQEYSNLFSAVTTLIAKKLKDIGVEYNEVYNNISPIKSLESTWSKINRSGSMDIRDQIRRTLFCNNAYDLSALENIIKEYNDCGYVIAPINIPVEKMIEKGYIPSKSELKKGFVELPDLDIRMDRDKITKFVPELNGYISKPQMSGYEDIQMRFINKNDTKKPNPIKHELIIIFGDNYAKAKHYESEKIYKYTRQLDELKFYKNTKSEGLKKRTSEYIDAIKTKLNSCISTNLFSSAKSLDVTNINNDIPLNALENAEQMKSLNIYFAKLREKGHNYYKIAEQRAKTDARRARITKSHEADSKLLAEIKKNLEESIEFFNKNKYFKNLPDIYPKTTKSA